MEASLVMFKADGERREFPLTKSEIVVGRKSTCDLRIPLSSVSRQHFKILLEDDTLTLRDLGSSNGTYHNDERVLEAELGPGDQVRVGPVTFIVTIDGEPSQVDIVKTVLPQDTGEIEAHEEPELPVDKPEIAEAIETADELPGKVEEESHTPTVDIEDDDDDPIAALEALALADDDDDDDDFIIPMSDDDEDETTKSS